jgi:exopolysaccharide production protein ExoQ
MSMRLARERFEALPLSRVMEIGFTIFAIYMFTNARLWWTWSPSSGQPDPSHDVSNPGGYTFLSVIYLVLLVLASRRPSGLWRAITADSFLVALLGLALASTVWSDAPDVAFRRGVALLGTSVFGVYLHVRYSIEEQLRLLGWGLGLAAVFSILQLGPSTLAQGAFSGVFENKNSLGRMMALATLVFVFLAWSRRPRAPAVLFAGLAFVLVLLSKSNTGLIVALTVMSVMPLLQILGQDTRLAVGIGSVAILVLGIGLLLAASHLEAVTSMVGRDATFTGRTDLWQYVIEMIRRRPWLGYGYETFWLWQLPWRLPVDEGAGWTAPNAHNGFLEVGLALGLVGLLVFVAGLTRGLARAVKHLQSQPGPLSLWPLVYLCFVLLYNTTEIAALTRNNLIWVVYVSTLLTVSPKGRQAASRSGVRGRYRAPPRVATGHAPPDLRAGAHPVRRSPGRPHQLGDEPR